MNEITTANIGDWIAGGIAILLVLVVFYFIIRIGSALSSGGMNINPPDGVSNDPYQNHIGFEAPQSNWDEYIAKKRAKKFGFPIDQHMNEDPAYYEKSPFNPDRENSLESAVLGDGWAKKRKKLIDAGLLSPISQKQYNHSAGLPYKKGTGFLDDPDDISD